MLLFVVGCDVSAPSSVVEHGVTQCEDNGGLESLQTHVSTPFESLSVKFICTNGAVFTYGYDSGVSEKAQKRRVMSKGLR
jgi:hypothetical protein